jgi:hypothetical protein
MIEPTIRRILDDYLHVGDDGPASPLAGGAAFWDALARGGYRELEHGRLLSGFEFDSAWTTWERHPAGEEVVLLLAGHADIEIETVDGARHAVSLRAPGDYVLVPRGAWHTARTSEPTRMLFLTPGAGTEHRPL